MTKNMKKYLAPEIKVVEIEQADIICKSGEEGYFEEPGPITPGEW